MMISQVQNCLTKRDSVLDFNMVLQNRAIYPPNASSGKTFSCSFPTSTVSSPLITVSLYRSHAFALKCLRPSLAWLHLCPP